MDPDKEPKLVSDADELGALAAETAADAEAQGDDEENIDRAALASLSQAQSRAPGPDDPAAPGAAAIAVAAATQAPSATGEGSAEPVAPIAPVNQDGAGSTPRVGSQPVPARNTTERVVAARASGSGSASWRWIPSLVLGFALGVPVGGWLFARSGPGNAEDSAAMQNATRSAQGETAVHPATSERAREPVLAEAAPARQRESDAAVLQPSASSAIGPGAAPLPESDPAAGQALANANTQERSAQADAPAAAGGSQPAAAAPGAKSVPAAAASAGAELRPAAAAPGGAQPLAASTKVPPAATAKSPGLAPAKPASAATSAATTPSVDELLDQALASSPKRAAPPPPMLLTTKETMPKTPSREDVKRAVTVLLPAIRGCARGQSGLATIGIVVSNDGRVVSADVTGAPFEASATGRCMEGVVRHARFPRFQQESFRVQFPFEIQ